MKENENQQNTGTSNLIEDKEEQNEDDYQLKICPTDKYGDKLIEILKKEFEEEE
ncbi:MAG: hypothetical protein GF317_14630 [Candidatus Lokiarchaeota archaeon]|nr:hypothetical protein [Candidatus Lokiarchaeota archaeon]MBD3200843.1 hypothetical protein [Candidatus Lokiarchaeota archaeon]